VSVSILLNSSTSYLIDSPQSFPTNARLPAPRPQLDVFSAPQRPEWHSCRRDGAHFIGSLGLCDTR
jgi:hypothetical protein